MPIYISRGRFTADAVKGMLAKPENREEAVAKLFKSVGGRLIGWYLTFGTLALYRGKRNRGAEEPMKLLLRPRSTPALLRRPGIS